MAIYGHIWPYAAIRTYMDIYEHVKLSGESAGGLRRKLFSKITYFQWKLAF